MQEYATAGHRAEIMLGLLTATPRLGVKPDKVDFEMLQDGEAAIFVLDPKFDPSTDVWPVPPPSGSVGFIDNAMNRIQQDTMAIIGMTQPQDVFNPEVMAAGNSGEKLSMALGPNQIIQDNAVRNAADGLKEAIWLVWRTLIQHGDDYGVKKLAQMFHHEKKPVFLDYEQWDDMNFCERKLMHIDLALGMLSEENQLQRQQIIVQCQQQLYQTTESMVGAGTLTPEVYRKIKKPYADSLYVLGIKNADNYLPTDQEVIAMIKQGQEAAKNRQPSPDDQAKTARASVDQAKAQEIMANIQGHSPSARVDLARAHQLAADTTGQSAKTQLEYMNVAQGKTAAGVSG